MPLRSYAVLGFSRRFTSALRKITFSLLEALTIRLLILLLQPYFVSPRNTAGFMSFYPRALSMHSFSIAQDVSMVLGGSWDTNSYKSFTSS